MSRSRQQRPHHRRCRERAARQRVDARSGGTPLGVRSATALVSEKRQRQLRHEADAEAGRHHAQHQVVVIDRVGHARRKAGEGAGAFGQLAVVGLARADDPILLGEALERDRLALAPPALGQGEHDGLLDQRRGDETGNIRLRRQAVGEADREVATAVAHRGDGVGRLQLMNDHAQLRIARPHASDRRQQPCLREGREAADLQHALGLFLGAFQILLRRHHRLQDGVGVGGQPLALRGQPHPPPDPLQQLGARFPFQDRQLLRHGGRGLTEGGADRGHGAAMGQFPEQAQAGEIEHQEYLTYMIRILK